MSSLRSGFGFKDIAYALKWEAKEYSLISRFFENIRLSHNNNMIDEFIDVGKKHLNDHKNSYLKYQNNRIEVLDSACANDLCTYQGLGRCARLIIGSVLYWTRIKCGSGSTAATPFDTDIETSISTATFATQGFIEPSGVTLRMAGIFPPIVPTNTIRECTVHDTSGGACLLRNVFSSNPISHTADRDTFTLASIVELAPIV